MSERYFFIGKGFYMKKRVVKAMSVGLSAITIASTMNVTVLADEAENGGAEVTTQDASSAAEEQETPAETSVPTVSESTKSVAEAIKSDDAAEGSVEAYLNDAAQALNDLADDGKDAGAEDNAVDLTEIENAADAAEEAKEAAEDADSDAVTAALEASNAAEAALETPTQANIDAAGEALEAANEAVETADTAVSEANTAVAAANAKIDQLLADNGLSDVEEEDLDNLRTALEAATTKAEVDDILAKTTLDGNAKKAIQSAAYALVQAKDDKVAAEQAKSAATAKVAEIEASYPYKISVQQGILNDEKSTDAQKVAATEELAKLTYEYYLTENGIEFVPGSVTLTKVTTEGNKALAESDWYYVVSYDVVEEVDGEEKTSTVNKNINYSLNGNSIEIKEKIVTPNVIVKPEVEAKPAEYQYKDSQGNALNEDNVKAEISVDDSTKVVVDNDTTIKKTQDKTASNQTVIEGTQKSEYTIQNVEEKTITTTDRQYFNNANDAKKALEDAQNNLGENQSVVLNVRYDGIIVDIDKNINDINGFEKLMSWIYSKFGANLGLNYTLSTTTVVPVVEVTETVKADVTQVDSTTKTSDTFYVTPFGKGADTKAREAAEKAVKAYENQGEGYSATYVINGWREWASYTITYTHTYIVNGVTVRETVYNGTTYTNTLVAQEVLHEDAVTKTTYEDGDTVQETANIEALNAEEYAEQKAVADNQAVVDAANNTVTKVQTALGTVVGAIKSVLGLEKVESYDSAEIQAGVSSTIEAASNTIDDAKDKKAANDAAEAARRAAEAAANAGGYNYGGGAAAEETPIYAVATTTTDEAVEADTTEITDEAVPAAGNTTNTRANRTNRTTRTANANADADADADATTIEDAETPLAGDTAEDVAEEKDESVTIADEETAKAGGEKSNFFARTWWGWLLALIAAVAGTTAYAKKKANAKNPTKSNK